MENVVLEYLSSKYNLLDYFDCSEDYYVKLAVGCNWRVKEIDGIYILTYWRDGGMLRECVIVKKKREPLIFRQDMYTLIVCIECVKVAIILKNSNEG